MARRDYDQGTTLPGPIRSMWMYKGDNPGGPGNGKQEFTEEIFRWNCRLRLDEFTDFAPGTTLGTGWSKRETKTAGTPTGAIQANVANGVYKGLLDATNEVQFEGIDWADQLVIPVTKHFLFEARVQVSALAANQDVIIGLGTAYASPLSSISKYVRFHYSGNLNTTVDATDGTTTVTGQAAGRGVTALTAATWYLFTVDYHAGEIRFFIDNSRVAVISTLTAFADTDLLQPIIGVQKSSGTGTPSILIDWVRAQWNRL